MFNRRLKRLEEKVIRIDSKVGSFQHKLNLHEIGHPEKIPLWEIASLQNKLEQAQNDLMAIAKYLEVERIEPDCLPKYKKIVKEDEIPGGITLT